MKKVEDPKPRVLAPAELKILIAAAVRGQGKKGLSKKQAMRIIRWAEENTVRYAMTRVLLKGMGVVGLRNGEIEVSNMELEGEMMGLMHDRYMDKVLLAEAFKNKSKKKTSLVPTDTADVKLKVVGGPKK